MSADLFAEFGASSTPKASQQKQPGGPNATSFGFFDDFTATPASTQTAPQPTALASSTQQDDGDNDDWGDFEGGASSFEKPPLVKQDSFAFVAAQATRARAPTLPATLENDDFFSHSTPRVAQTTWQRAPIVKAKKSTDPSVLFDAEDDFGNDDFGDFEGTESAPTQPIAAPTSSTGIADLLEDLDLSQPTVPPSIQQNATSHKTSTSTSLKSPIGGFGSVAPNQHAKATTAPPAPKEEESWDTFDDWEASIPTKAPARDPARPPPQKKADLAPKKTIKPNYVTSAPPILSPTFDDPHPGELPPTNVPPPAVLLTLFPPLFADAQEKLFKPMAAQTLPMRNKVLAEPATITYLEGYIMLASVAAHIIAGRKLRWKRDQHLSQGMRIGPASSRATSGMKLSSIDKSENMKEEREASDVVRAWKDQVGRLRHVVSAANQIRAGSLGAVPDIQETMPVKVLKQGEGGVPAKEPCMLCGLKRDERVGAVDQGAEDSFGEWWVEQVNMHRSCQNFWGEHKDLLRQR
ncbi:uncharacterized protein N0V89_001333 [Didymosphaeria variabile]|uniref:Serine/threonine-protein kinase ppk6 n=1 Tax=Didymosphaeria variabile TaxID=1932322 RepID=A0A9W8XWU4_9PLEO|nr:uncharacterized protein N0V89_001333 [Didymosphaeria variabile]KAJ4360766.1 hypothetical protein N0V89_001333 [Didymosphaeria variabile]